MKFLVKDWQNEFYFQKLCLYMDAFEPKWVNSILNIIGDNSFRHGSFYIEIRPYQISNLVLPDQLKHIKSHINMVLSHNFTYLINKKTHNWLYGGFRP